MITKLSAFSALSSSLLLVQDILTTVYCIEVSLNDELHLQPLFNIFSNTSGGEEGKKDPG